MTNDEIENQENFFDYIQEHIDTFESGMKSMKRVYIFCNISLLILGTYGLMTSILPYIGFSGIFLSLCLFGVLIFLDYIYIILIKSKEAYIRGIKQYTCTRCGKIPRINYSLSKIRKGNVIRKPNYCENCGNKLG